jgi:hypothetical protein
MLVFCYVLTSAQIMHSRIEKARGKWGEALPLSPWAASCFLPGLLFSVGAGGGTQGLACAGQVLTTELHPAPFGLS